MSDIKSNLRDLLIALGVGQFNATMMIQYLSIAPATTDPKSPQIALLVRHIQQALYGIGERAVANSGVLDRPTASALDRIVGVNWERQPWSVTIAAVVNAMRRPSMPSMMTLPAPIDDIGTPVAVGGVFDFLPDVPGGLLTYAVGGYLLYRFISKPR